jgi:hypothetical protein
VIGVIAGLRRKSCLADSLFQMRFECIPPCGGARTQALEEQFGMLDMAAAGGGGAKASAAPAKKAVMLLTMQRSNNVGVLLANLKMPPAEVSGRRDVEEGGG